MGCKAHVRKPNRLSNSDSGKGEDLRNSEVSPKPVVPRTGRFKVGRFLSHDIDSYMARAACCDSADHAFFKIERK